MEKENHFDVLIIGAGISGIDAAYHIQKNCDWVSKKKMISVLSFSNSP
jgi:flavin-dependent dehydrogenase